MTLTPEQEASWACDCAERALARADSQSLRVIEAARLSLAGRLSPDYLRRGGLSGAPYDYDAAAVSALLTVGSVAHDAASAKRHACTASCSAAVSAPRSPAAERTWQRQRRAWYAKGGEIPDPLAGLSEAAIEVVLGLFTDAGMTLANALAVAPELLS